jgi:YVTN family beta-propeller protein/YD repeat-containing protein
VTPDGAVAYVTNQGDNTISVVNLSTRQEVTKIPTGHEPAGIALAGNMIARTISSRTATDRSRLEYDSSTATYTRLYPDGTRVHFDPDGTHDYTVDRHGNRTAYTYNADGTTAAMTITPAGETTPRWTWTFSYQSGKLATITDPAGRVTTFTIDGNNHLTAITAALPSWEGSGVGSTVHYAYDDRGLMTHTTDEQGNITEHTYDTYGRITQVKKSPRAVADSGSGQTTAGQETITLTTEDTGYPLINDSPVGNPDNPAPAVPTSPDIVARVEYARGSERGHLGFVTK